jgi:dUTP pyrophosphatase
VKIKIKKLNLEAKVPTYAHPGDAGMDVVAISKTETEKFVEYGTGLAFELPTNHVLLVFPCSSISNTDLSLTNCVGVLDSGYRGELKMRFRKNGEVEYAVGERIGQILVLPYPEIDFEEAEELADSARGEGGFGSTGQK